MQKKEKKKKEKGTKGTEGRGEGRKRKEGSGDNYSLWFNVHLSG